jgi:N-acetyl-anhydromuramyl-L-alanine amidase AmpD
VGIVKKQSRRSFTVLASLVGVLTLTSVLLRAMQGAPLTADAASNLVASDSRAALEVIFNTEAPPQVNRWNAIYIHHSRTTNGGAQTLIHGEQGCGDHFVIGNGDGAVDGEIQFSPRWNTQRPAEPAPGCANIDANCISICLVGDFDKTAPTPTQLKRLEHLVQALQERFHIPATQVWHFDYAGSSAGAGRYFPSSAFQGQLLR